MKEKKKALFYDKVHDEFMVKLRDGFLREYGIDIKNIRIDSFKIVNEELSDSISKQAFVTAQTATQLSNLAGQTEIATAQQLRDSEILRIRAEGEARKLLTETTSFNNARMDNARADSDSLLIKAESEAKALSCKAQAEANALAISSLAESKALLIKAEAEANALLVKAEAESQRATLLSRIPLGGQLALFDVYTDMVTKSMEGVEKVIYLPSDKSGDNPLNFFSMYNGFQGFFPGMSDLFSSGGSRGISRHN